jgi:DNA-binding CsgD family transcriptional regulator
VPELPGPLRLLPSTPFVGRAQQLAVLRALVPRADGEGCRIVLLAGEAGSGKSRVVREFAREAAERDVRVLYGACDAVVRRPYGPFVDALDQYTRARQAAELRADLGVAGGELGRLLPELPARVPGLGGPLAADPDTERHRLHTAVADVLTNAAQREPLLLALEDLHWADGPTLLLLRHLARTLTAARVLVLATFRDVEAEVAPVLVDALADLHRSEAVVRIPVSGLTGPDIAEFLSRASGEQHPAQEGLGDALRDLTGGNAFLVCELWRTMVDSSALAVRDGTLRLLRPLAEVATPQSVREVVSQRASRLDPRSLDLLELAAVAGPKFELGLLRRAGGQQVASLEALEPAVLSGMIQELPGAALAFRFTHELVRRALYDRLGVMRRAELHLRVAEALEASGSSSRGRNLADLAHHFAAAAPLASSERAVEYHLMAARAAVAALAYGEAAALLRTALEIGCEDPAQRAQVLTELGTALFRAGRSIDALQSFRDAAAIARTLGAGELLAHAAIGFEMACWRPGLSDQGARELLEEASAMLAAEDSPLRVGVLGGLARALEFQGEALAAKEARARAIAMARRAGDRRGLATVLMGAYWSRSTAELNEILEMLAEARDLGQEIGDIEIQAEATEWRVSALMALGAIERAREELGTALEMAQRLRQPFVVHVAEHYRSALALLAGNLAEAEAAAERSREWGRLLTGRDASAIFGIQMFSVRREQGRLAELAPVIRVLVAAERGSSVWRPGLAAVLAELGMHEEAHEELDRIRSAGLASLRSLWVAALSYLADAAAAVSDRQMAALVYPELAALSGSTVMIGHGVACYGSVDRYLGMLAATLGDAATAARHYEDALALNRRIGARTWLAHTAYWYARTLLANGQLDRGRSLAAEALQLAEEIGMTALASRARSLGPDAAAATLDGLSDREADVLRLVAGGRSNREIGLALHISEHTVANHVRAILRKTSCTNRTEATAYAYRRGLVAG